MAAERDELAAAIQRHGYCGDYDPDPDDPFSFACEACSNEARRIADALIAEGWTRQVPG
jgi:hypothetical protein